MPTNNNKIKGSQNLIASLTPNDNDVLFGRGGLSNVHKGNRIFRQLVRENRTLYQGMTNPTHKRCLILSIVKAVERRGGRFLRKEEKGVWVQAREIEVRRKAAQALRENETPTFSSPTTVVSSHEAFEDQQEQNGDDAIDLLFSEYGKTDENKIEHIDEKQSKNKQEFLGQQVAHHLCQGFIPTPENESVNEKSTRVGVDSEQILMDSDPKVNIDELRIDSDADVNKCETSVDKQCIEALQIDSVDIKQEEMTAVQKHFETSQVDATVNQEETLVARKCVEGLRIDSTDIKREETLLDQEHIEPLEINTSVIQEEIFVDQECLEALQRDSTDIKQEETPVDRENFEPLQIDTSVKHLEIIVDQGCIEALQIDSADIKQEETLIWQEHVEPLQIDTTVLQEEMFVDQACIEPLQVASPEVISKQTLVGQAPEILAIAAQPKMYCLPVPTPVPNEESYEPLHIDTIPSGSLNAVAGEFPLNQEDERVSTVPPQPPRQGKTQCTNPPKLELFDKGLLDRVLGSPNSPNRFSRRRRLMR